MKCQHDKYQQRIKQKIMKNRELKKLKNIIEVLETIQYSNINEVAKQILSVKLIESNYI